MLSFELSKTLQRYENKSKSQLQGTYDNRPVDCLRLCKDTKIKANHNLYLYTIVYAKTV